MLNSLFGLICTCHVLGLRLFCVAAAPGPPEEVNDWNFEPIDDEISMVQTSARSHQPWMGQRLEQQPMSMRSHQTLPGQQPGQQPIFQADHGRPLHQFGKVPIYGYDRVHHNNLKDTWMLMFPETYTSKMLWEICSKFASPGVCNYVGHPEDGGLSYISIASFEDEMRLSISASCAEPQTSTSATLCAARYAELDAPVMLDDPQFSALPEVPASVGDKLPWGLDRIDDRDRELDGKYKVEFTGKGIHVFVFDTGINCELDDFSNRAIPSFDATEAKPVECDEKDFKCALDKHGHGTHTAGTVGSLTYGVAIKATIRAVKILDDSGYGSWSAFVDAVDWVITRVKKERLKRAIISASLGGAGPTAVVSEAVQKATEKGIAVVVAAGNADADACMSLPASVKAAITVGSVDFIDNYDIKSSFSNYGLCIDIFAPGTNITSLSHEKKAPPVVFSGTSMSCPHVAGVVALLFEQDSSLDGKTVNRALKGMSSKGCVKNLFPRGSTPNRLLYFGKDSASHPCKRKSLWAKVVEAEEEEQEEDEQLFWDNLRNQHAMRGYA